MSISRRLLLAKLGLIVPAAALLSATGARAANEFATPGASTAPAATPHHRRKTKKHAASRRHHRRKVAHSHPAENG